MYDRRNFLVGAAVAGFTATLHGCVTIMRDRPFFSEVDRPIGLQTYTLGDEIVADIPAAFARIAAIGYRELQLPGLYDQTPEMLAAAASNAGLPITSLHLAVSTRGNTPGLSLSSPVQEIVDSMGVLGAKQAVLPMLAFPENMKPRDGEDVRAMIARSILEAGPDLWKRTAALLNEKGALLKPEGISLGYHNHNMEFAPLGETTGWDILVDETDPNLVEFELDVGWVAAAGLDPANLLASLAGRVSLLHVKDLTAATKPNYALAMQSTEIGAGIQDWPAILAAAEKAGVRHYYVEQEPPFAIPRFEAITKSFQYLSALSIPAV